MTFSNAIQSRCLANSQTSLEGRMKGHSEYQVSKADGVMGSKFTGEAAGIFLSKSGSDEERRAKPIESLHRLMI